MAAVLGLKPYFTVLLAFLTDFLLTLVYSLIKECYMVQQVVEVLLEVSAMSLALVQFTS
jgi:hypothetical protein